MGLNPVTRRLIQGYACGDPVAVSKFRDTYEGRIKNLAWKYTRNEEVAEDVKQDVLTKLYVEFQDLDKYEKIDNFNSWLMKVVKNQSIDHIRKQKNRVEISDIKDPSDSDHPEKIYYEKEKKKIEKRFEKLSTIEKLKISKPDLLKSLEISIKYIDWLYIIKRDYKEELKEYGPIFKIAHTLYYAKKNIDVALNQLSKTDISRFNNIKERCKNFDSLESMFQEINMMICTNSFLNPLLGEWEPAEFPEMITEFVRNVSSAKISPIKLIFWVWHKALRKGRYGNNKAIKNLLLIYKEETKGTNREYLFHTEGHLNIKILRKAMYQKPQIKEFYDKLIDFIYKKSFIEKIAPDYWPF